jgi:uncharacterized cupin superfamily protein
MNLIKKSKIAKIEETKYDHPMNPKATRFSKKISADLESIGVHIARVEPGKESTALHSHYEEDECIYILEGSGISIIENVYEKIETGDFIAYPKKGAAHKLINTGKTDLVYLMIGEHKENETVIYPEAKKIMNRIGTNKIYNDL